ncbi:MAG: RnfH family protein [Pseudomonadota bacterium]
MTERLRIEFVYALPQEQEVINLDLPLGSTVQQALDASGVLQKYPEIDLAQHGLGIFSKKVKAETILRDRDRVELYRPLPADAKTLRHQRVANIKKLKQEANKSAQKRPKQSSNSG